MDDFARIQTPRVKAINDALDKIEKSGRSQRVDASAYQTVLGDVIERLNSLCGDTAAPPRPQAVRQEFVASAANWSSIKTVIDDMPPHDMCDVLHYTSLQLQNKILAGREE